MKRIYIAVIFLLFAAVISGIELGYVSAKTDLIVSKIEESNELMVKKDYKKAIELCKNIEKEWDESAESINMLLIHDYVDSIGINISKMRSYAENSSTDLYFAASAGVKKELTSLKESEFPYIENLL